MANAPIKMELTDYASLRAMRYPRRIVRQWGPETIDATVEKWEAVEKFDDKVFEPLSNSIVWDWCSTPKIEMPKSNPSYVSPINVDPISGTLSSLYFGIYKVVRADGTVKDATLLLGSQKGFAEALLDMQRHNRSAIVVCGVKPVEYETILAMW